MMLPVFYGELVVATLGGLGSTFSEAMPSTCTVRPRRSSYFDLVCWPKGGEEGPGAGSL